MTKEELQKNFEAVQKAVKIKYTKNTGKNLDISKKQAIIIGNNLSLFDPKLEMSKIIEKSFKEILVSLKAPEFKEKKKLISFEKETKINGSSVFIKSIIFKLKVEDLKDNFYLKCVISSLGFEEYFPIFENNEKYYSFLIEEKYKFKGKNLLVNFYLGDNLLTENDISFNLIVEEIE